MINVSGHCSPHMYEDNIVHIGLMYNDETYYRSDVDNVVSTALNGISSLSKPKKM